MEIGQLKNRWFGKIMFFKSDAINDFVVCYIFQN